MEPSEIAVECALAIAAVERTLLETCDPGDFDNPALAGQYRELLATRRDLVALRAEAEAAVARWQG